MTIARNLADFARSLLAGGTIPNATTSVAGLQSAADKTKLNALSTSLPSLNHALFTSSGSWTVPAGVTRVRATVVGGGGGGVSNGSENTAPGGLGGVAYGEYTVTPGASITVTVGAGGAAGILVASSSAGGSSSFGAFASATGGGAAISSPTPIGGANGAGSSGTIYNSTSTVRQGAVFPYLQSTGGSRPQGSGLAAAVAFSPSANLAPGAAGAGSSGNTPSGGVGGAVIIEWIA